MLVNTGPGLLKAETIVWQWNQWNWISWVCKNRSLKQIKLSQQTLAMINSEIKSLILIESRL